MKKIFKTNQERFDYALKCAGGNMNCEDFEAFAQGHGYVNTMRCSMWRDGGIGHCGMCGACIDRNTMRQLGFKHKDYMVCPVCGEKVLARSVGMLRNSVQKEFYAVKWTNCAEAVVMCGYYCYFEATRPKPWQAKLLISPTRLMVAEYGRGFIAFKRYAPSYLDDFSRDANDVNEWFEDERPNTGASLPAGCGGRKIDLLIDRNDMMQVFKQSSFNAAYDYIANLCVPYEIGDGQRVIASLSKRPCLEYLYKMGFDNLANEGIYGFTKDSHMRVNAKDCRSVFGLTKWEIGEMRAHGCNPYSEDIARYKLLKGLGSIKPKPSEIGKHAYYRGRLSDDLLAYIGRMPYEVRRAAVDYAIGLKHGIDRYQLRDHWKMLFEIGENIGDRRMICPKNFDEMHTIIVQRTNAVLEERRAQETAKKDSGVKKRADKLKMYVFTNESIVMTPFDSAAEIVREGACLKHCVATYIDRYIKGDTILCKLRKNDEPDKPWRTVEFSADGRLVQVRGYMNSSGTKEEQELVRNFMDVFICARRTPVRQAV